MVDTLKGKGPFTVFAPTDDAFAKLPAGTVETLLKPENKDQLAGILTYHVVAGRVMAADVVKLTSADTVNGTPVTIMVDGDKVFINDAQVIITDILTSNGVIHVIDRLSCPPSKKFPILWLLAARKAGGLSFRKCCHRMTYSRKFEKVIPA